MPVRVIHRGRIFMHHEEDDYDYQSIDLDGGFVERDKKWIYAPEKVRSFTQKFLPQKRDVAGLVRAVLEGQPCELNIGEEKYVIKLKRHEMGEEGRFFLHWDVNGEDYLAVARPIMGDISVFIVKEDSPRIPVGLFFALSHASREIVASRQRQTQRRGNFL